ncbi:MAG: hypothetical protein AB1633_08820 [Elusimicrobiota bacterium]
MKKINYGDYISEKKKKYFDLPARLGRKRMTKRRVRNPEERLALMKLDYLRYRKWLKEGVLKKISPKKYIFS